MKRRAFVMADVLTGLFVLSVLAGVVVTTATRQSRTVARLERIRQATRQAEQVMFDLRAGNAPHAAEGCSFIVTPEHDAAAIGNLQWVRVAVKCGDESATLVGLARRSGAALEGTQ